MENEDARTLATLGALIIDLYARQIALLAMLRTPNPDWEPYREALRKAHEQVNRIPEVANLRSRASVHGLEELETRLRGMVVPD